MEIEIIVREKVARLANKHDFAVCGNSDYKIKFDFDSEWDAYEVKTARFKYNGTYTDVVFNGCECPMPIITSAFRVEVGVYAGDLRTTSCAVLPLKKSILCGDEIESKGKLLGANEIIEAIEEKNDKEIQSVTNIVNEGYNKVVTAIGNMFGKTETVLCSVTLSEFDKETKLCLIPYDSIIEINKDSIILERLKSGNIINDYECDAMRNIYRGPFIVFIGLKPEGSNVAPYEGIALLNNNDIKEEGMSIELIKVDYRKIPIEYVDTRDIENTIQSIANEARSL